MQEAGGGNNDIFNPELSKFRYLKLYSGLENGVKIFGYQITWWIEPPVQVVDFLQCVQKLLPGTVILWRQEEKKDSLLFLLSHIESICGLHRLQTIIPLFQPETFPSDQDNYKYAKLALMKSHSLHSLHRHKMTSHSPDKEFFVWIKQ